MEFLPPFASPVDEDLGSWRLFFKPSATGDALLPTDTSSFAPSSLGDDDDHVDLPGQLSPLLPCNELELLGLTIERGTDADLPWQLPHLRERHISPFEPRKKSPTGSHKGLNSIVPRSDEVVCIVPHSSLEPWPLDKVGITIVDHLDEVTESRLLMHRLGEADLVRTVLETFGSKPRTKKICKDSTSSKRAAPLASVHVARKAAWHAKYRDLLEFYQEHGHCNVPSTYPPNPSLSHWVKRQRSNWKHYRCNMNGSASSSPPSSSLDQERIDLLNRLGFVWDMYKDAWESKYQLLLDYQHEYGTTNVPMSVDTVDSFHSKYVGLGVWVKSQRRHYQLLHRYGYAKSNLTPKRVARLDAIHFDWDPRNRKAEGTNFGLLL